MSLIPVRCFTCGGMLAPKYNRFQRLCHGSDDGRTLERALDQARIRRACCRALALGQCNNLLRHQMLARDVVYKSTQPPL